MATPVWPSAAFAKTSSVHFARLLPDNWAARAARACTAGATRHHDLAGVRLLGRFSDGDAGVEVVIDRLMEGVAKATHAVGMEAHDIVHAQQMANEDLVLGVEFDDGVVSLVADGLHGFTPILVRNSRASRT